MKATLTGGTGLFDGEDSSGHHWSGNSCQPVVSGYAGLEPDVNHLGRFTGNFKTKTIPPELRPADLEVTSQPVLLGFNVEEPAIVGFELALNQKIRVFAVPGFRETYLEV